MGRALHAPASQACSYGVIRPEATQQHMGKDITPAVNNEPGWMGLSALADVELDRLSQVAIHGDMEQIGTDVVSTKRLHLDRIGEGNLTLMDALWGSVALNHADFNLRGGIEFSP